MEFSYDNNADAADTINYSSISYAVGEGNFEMITQHLLHIDISNECPPTRESFIQMMNQNVVSYVCISWYQILDIYDYLNIIRIGTQNSFQRN